VAVGVPFRGLKVLRDEPPRGGFVFILWVPTAGARGFFGGAAHYYFHL
jgi:hypothetical protein